VFADLELNDAEDQSSSCVAIKPDPPSPETFPDPVACAAHSSAEDFRSGKYKLEGF